MMVWQWRLIWRYSWLRSQWMFLAALVVSLSVLVTMGGLTYQLHAGMQATTRNLLAGDRVIVSPSPLSPELLHHIHDRGADIAVSVTFPTMLVHGNQMQLASVRAVSDQYPLYGMLTLQPQGRIQPGEIWLSDSLQKLLGVHTGDMVQVGMLNLRVAGTVVSEPDQDLNPFALAPRAFMAEADVAAAQILMPGSRAEFRVFLRGLSDTMTAMDHWLVPQLSAEQKWITPAQSSSRYQVIFQQSTQFFYVIGGIAGVFSLLALIMSLYHVCHQLRATVLLLRTLGASRRQIFAVLSVMLGCFMAIGCGLGIGIGYSLLGLLHQQLLVFLPTAPVQLPWSVWLLLTVCAIAALAIALIEPLNQLLRTPLSELQHRLQLRFRLFPVVVAIFLVSGLIWLGQAGIGQSTLWIMMSACSGVGLVLALCAYAVVRILPEGRIGSGYQLAVHTWKQQPGWVFRQTAMMGFVFVLVGVALFLRQDLRLQIAPYLSATAPNRFLLNIPTEQQPDIARFLADRQIQHAAFYPVVRGRLVQINQDRIQSENNDASSPGRKGIDRELTMTAVASLPPDNPVVAGAAWDPTLTAQVSVEEKTATSLAIHVGDQLYFRVEGQEFQVNVRNIRRVNWQSLQPNFIMIFSPDVLKPFTSNWMTSLRLTGGQSESEIALIRQYPTVTVLNIDAIMTQIQQVLTQLSNALLLLLILVSAGAVMVLIVQWQGVLDQRRQEFVLLRVLGASNRQLYRLLLWQAVLLGGITGLVAAGLCDLARWSLLSRIGNTGTGAAAYLSTLWFILPVMGAAVVLLMSILFLVPIVRQTLKRQMYPG